MEMNINSKNQNFASLSHPSPQPTAQGSESPLLAKLRALWETDNTEKLRKIAEEEAYEALKKQRRCFIYATEDHKKTSEDEAKCLILRGEMTQEKIDAIANEMVRMGWKKCEMFGDKNFLIAMKLACDKRGIACFKQGDPQNGFAPKPKPPTPAPAPAPELELIERADEYDIAISDDLKNRDAQIKRDITSISKKLSHEFKEADEIEKKSLQAKENEKISNENNDLPTPEKPKGV
jgi:hypothetical protein